MELLPLFLLESPRRCVYCTCVLSVRVSVVMYYTALFFISIPQGEVGPICPYNAPQTRIILPAEAINHSAISVSKQSLIVEWGFDALQNCGHYLINRPCCDSSSITNNIEKAMVSTRCITDMSIVSGDEEDRHTHTHTHTRIIYNSPVCSCPGH